MDEKIFQPEKYSMVICPSYNAQGYIQSRGISIRGRLTFEDIILISQPLESDNRISFLFLPKTVILDPSLKKKTSPKINKN